MRVGRVIRLARFVWAKFSPDPAQLVDAYRVESHICMPEILLKLFPIKTGVGVVNHPED
jgi:hypothetical protein